MNKAIIKAADKIASQKWIPKWIREKVLSVAKAFTDFIDSIFQKVIKKKIKVGDWEYSDNSYHNGDGSRPYQDSPNIIKEIINSGPAGVDPGKSNGLWWKIDGHLMVVMELMNYYLAQMEKQYGILYIKVIDGG